MNWNQIQTWRWPGLGLCFLLGLLGLPGCGAKDGDPAAQVRQEQIEKLRQETQELPQARAQNEEVQRLKQENQELPKLRSQYQEVARLRKENDQIRRQIIKISPSSATNLTAAALASLSSHSAAADEPEQPKPGPEEEFALHEGDEIYVDPKFLKQLLPDMDWEKLGRKDPISIRSLIEKDGFEMTNALQLHEFGITNFVIRRAPPPATPQEAPAR